jgi:hypothetical protein
MTAATMARDMTFDLVLESCTPMLTLGGLPGFPQGMMNEPPIVPDMPRRRAW